MTRRILVREVVQAVAQAYELEIPALTGRSSRREYTVPRQVAMYLAYKLTLASLPMIGRGIGDRDHTTIMHGVRVIDSRIARDPKLAAQVADLTSALKALAEADGDPDADELAAPAEPPQPPAPKPTPPRHIVPRHTAVLTMLGRYLASREALRRSEFTRDEALNRRKAEADFKVLATAYEAYLAGGQQ